MKNATVMQGIKRRVAALNNYNNEDSSSLLPTHQTNAMSGSSSSGKGDKRALSSKPRKAASKFQSACLVVLGFLFFFLIVGKILAFLPPRIPYYIPKRQKADSSASEWDWPLVHVVNTRFMQEQGNLTALGSARLALFKVFCLPTMIQQSSQKFIWIIKTDPNLDVYILQDLIDSLSPYPNFYLTASNNNFRINENFTGAWRGGAETTDLTLSRVYTGNRTLLEMAMSVGELFPVLETRLDSDDGLHKDYIRLVQEKAVQAFIEDPDDQGDSADEPLRWMYWCATHHVEWHWKETSVLEDDLGRAIRVYGGLDALQHSKLCITPGFTVGFNVGVKDDEVPLFAHDQLVREIVKIPVEQGCGRKETRECLQFIDELKFEAVRSRCPTSAGMLRVLVDEHQILSSVWAYFAFTTMLHDDFGIRQEHLKFINRYMSDHIIEIATENLAGQCTTGHSCKEKAKKSLQALIESRKNVSNTAH